MKSSYIGEDAAYKRLLSYAHDLPMMNRIVYDLTWECREALIGMASYDLDQNPNNVTAWRIRHLCRLANR